MWVKGDVKNEEDESEVQGTTEDTDSRGGMGMTGVDTQRSYEV